MRSKISMLAGSIIIATTLLAGCDQKASQPVKFIDTERVMQDSGLAEQLQARLKAVDETLQQGLKLAQENGAKLPEEKRRAAQIADQQLLNLEWQHAKNQVNSVALKALTEAADAYRQQHQLLAILPARSALASAPEADISAELTKQLKDIKLDFGALPEIGAKSNKEAATEQPPVK